MAENNDKVLEIIEVARTTGRIRKGVNEVTKQIERGNAKFVAVAENVTPKEITLHLPVLAKEKGVPFFTVSSREDLGAAAGMSLATACVVVIEEGNAKKLIASLGAGTSSGAE